MQLQLTYDPGIRHNTVAAFIRGTTARQWLMEMSRWDIPLEHLQCLPVPDSTSSVRPAGLLVIFNQDIPAEEKITHPYGAVAGKLYLPVNASLFPVLSNTEMDELLIWHKQVFHPSSGFVGFEQEDILYPAQFITYPKALPSRWGQAHSGLPPMSPLESISLPPQPENNLMVLLDQRIDSRPLADIHEDKRRGGLLLALIDRILYPLLKLIMFFINLFRKQLPAKRGPGNGRFTGWAKQKLEDIAARRQSELQRLLNMFDKDGDEALRYALPLHNKYEGRGTAAPASTLSRNNTNFSLGGLGGGGPVDNWHTSEDQYSGLRAKYLAQAEKAEAAGDYSKAAYILAHLLGDYSGAAQVLEKGHFYREAAALYNDHLKMPIAAAQCLERGGLLLEAIEIYKKLEGYEKVGDLYTRLSQQQQAEKYFRLTAETALAQKDHLTAARIYNEKLQLREHAQGIWLQGWASGPREEECLICYFRSIQDEDTLPEKIMGIYNQVPAHRKSSLLNVLLIISKQATEETMRTSRDIAYRIISEQLANGNYNQINILKQLIPDDNILYSDLNRFRYNPGRPSSH
ncbi:hypothetical protein [Chitinophaga tropicalis]|uniref:MoxR-vWA-beta-propeller ternary system domain-containing protein n=1 Tax=Chitinophaga tropicalis TaxID=2683588 RepID=A0A7K1U486_9BACT|nr:hypothetical protein [Chitinophaga tropicalis]MVT09174.1 hypothetical protein [Chitinophaga tropicalis]